MSRINKLRFMSLDPSPRQNGRRRAFSGLRPIPICIAGGQRPQTQGMVTYVPRHYLISVLQVLFQDGRLRIARDLEFAPVLERELINFLGTQRAGVSMRTAAS